MVHQVKVGQIWIDNGRVDRKLRVDRIDFKYAYCTCLNNNRKTRILLKSFNNKPNGYSLENSEK